MITKEMIIGDIIARYPETIHVFKEYALDCYECQIADLETLDHGAGVHRVALDKLLKSLNEAIEINRDKRNRLP